MNVLFVNIVLSYRLAYLDKVVYQFMEVLFLMNVKPVPQVAA